MSQPIINASDRSLFENVGTLPNMQDAMQNWFQNMTFTLITTSVVNFDAASASTQVTMQGVKQPFTDQQINMKPIGQRKWKWFTIHAYPGVTLDIDDQMIFPDGTNYRVMQKYDTTEYGYIRYEVVQDYDGV